MPRPSARDHLIAEGLRVIHRLGYHNAGVGDIAAAAGLPKGSFYNYFPSKEAFGQEILNNYFASMVPILAATMENDALAGRERLARLLDELTAMMTQGDWAGCLLGNFANDASPHSEALRNQVNTLFARWQAAMRYGIQAGQQDGTLCTALAPDDAASWFVSGWEGAVLRAKAARNAQPLQEFRRAAMTLLSA